MRNITITDGQNTVTLRNDLIFELGYEEVGTKRTMASGKQVKDIIGYRAILTIPTGYLELADYVRLSGMIRSGKFLQITYPGVEGEKTGMFDIEPPTNKTFKYGDDGVTMWYAVTLTCTAQEVE